MIFLKAVRNLGPNYYHVARFWRREIPFRDKLRHANDREYQRLLDAVNPVAYRKASQHKALEKATLTLFGVRTPKFVGCFHPTRGSDGQGQPLRSGSDLARLLLRYAGQRLCFKAVEGFGGLSFAALDVMQGGAVLRHPITGQCWTTEEWSFKLAEAPAGWLIEEYLPQHPEIAEINPSSVNTLRVWVIERDDGFHAYYAALRIGRAGSQVDNTTSGGFACVVNPSTGCLEEGLDLHNPFHPIARHPDTGVSLEGRRVPFWPEVLELGSKALSVFPEMRFAGLDIAIAPDGPVVIELNVAPDRLSAVRWDVPHKDFFEPTVAMASSSRARGQR
jgi:hypothetical protein